LVLQCRHDAHRPFAADTGAGPGGIHLVARPDQKPCRPGGAGALPETGHAARQGGCRPRSQRELPGIEERRPQRVLPRGRGQPDFAAYRRVGALLRKYADLRPDWADVMLVWLAEQSGIHKIATLDVRDFSAYRIQGRSKFLLEPIE